MPDNPVAHLFLGDFCYRSGDLAGARRAWLAARELKPDDPEIEKRLKAAAGSLAR